MFGLSKHTKGVLFGVAGIMFLTPDTLLLRATDELPMNEVMFWRYLLTTLTLICFTFVDSWYHQNVEGNGNRLKDLKAEGAETNQKGEKATVDVKYKEKDKESIFSHVLQKFSAMGRYGYLAAIFYATCNICFLLAVRQTYAANVLVIISTSSIFAAIISYFLLDEKLKIHTLCTCLICFGSILFIFSDEIFTSKDEEAHRSEELFSSEDQIIGNLLALVVAVGSGAYFTLLRFVIKREGNVDLIPVNITACGIVLFASLCFPNNGSTRIGEGVSSVMSTTKIEILYLLLQGLISIPVSFSLLTHASTLINSAEVAMIMTIETVLGPLWVWLGGWEAPPANTVYGGVFIVISLCVHEWINLRNEREHDLQTNVTAEFEVIQTSEAEPTITASSTNVTEVQTGAATL